MGELKTECQACTVAEMSAAARAIDTTLRIFTLWWTGRDYREPRFTIRYAALLTGRPEPTWYDRHRCSYERTGDPLELTRMLRHVEEARPR